jgi:hypothetical protein
MSTSLQTRSLEETIISTLKNDSNILLPIKDSIQQWHFTTHNRTLSMPVWPVNAFAEWLYVPLIGNVTTINNPDQTPHNGWDGYLIETSAEMQAILLAMNTSGDGFPNMMERIASSMTTTLCGLSYQNASQGEAHVPVVIVSVEWRWMTFPFALLLSGLLFLLMVINQSHGSRARPWKNDILAIVFHGPGNIGLGDYQPLASLEQMQTVAKKKPR